MLDDPDASLDLLKQHPNLVLLRTFSKIYGLCGLRVGFALCGSEAFVQAVDQVRQPFFCNAAAQAAAIEALSTRTRSPSASSARSWRASRWRTACERLGLRVAESQANFCWLHLPDGGADEAGGRRRARASAACSCAPGTALGREGALRVTYGTPRRRTRRFLARAAASCSLVSHAALSRCARRRRLPHWRPHDPPAHHARSTSASTRVARRRRSAWYWRFS